MYDDIAMALQVSELFYCPANFAQSELTRERKSEVGGTVDPSARSSRGPLLQEVSGTWARGTEIETDATPALPTRTRRCTPPKEAKHGVDVEGAVRGGIGIMSRRSYHSEHSHFVCA